jgi:hypothetical protein
VKLARQPEIKTCRDSEAMEFFLKSNKKAPKDVNWGGGRADMFKPLLLKNPSSSSLEKVSWEVSVVSGRAVRWQ